MPFRSLSFLAARFSRRPETRPKRDVQSDVALIRSACNVQGEHATMKYVIITAACLASPLWALEVQAPLTVRAAEVFPSGAKVTLEISAEPGPGVHTVSTLVPGEILRDSGLDFQVDGGVLRHVDYSENFDHLPEVFETALQAEARATVEAAEAARNEAAKAREDLEAQIASVDARVNFVLSIGGGETLPAPNVLRALSSAIDEELSALSAARAALVNSRDAANEEIEDLELALAQARGRYERLTAPQSNWVMVSAEVSVSDAGAVTLTSDFFQNEAQWSLSYGVDLVEGEDRVDVTRRLTLEQFGPLSWVGTEVTLSTATPTLEVSVADVGRSIAQLGPQFEARALSRADGVVAEPVFEVASEAPFVLADTDGPVVSYRLGEAFTLYRSAAAEVSLAPVSLDADVYLAAAPRFDETAFVMADLANTFAEPFLPGEAMFRRDGLLVGLAEMPAIPAGGAATLGFGPEVDVALSYQAIDVQSGDRGLIRSSNTREDDIVLTAKNLGEQRREVRLRYAVPTSQQEDLSIDVDMTPRPTRLDVDNKLGVHEWDLALPPGAEEVIALRFRMEWPEGQELFWRP